VIALIALRYVTGFGKLKFTYGLNEKKTFELENRTSKRLEKPFFEMLDRNIGMDEPIYIWYQKTVDPGSLIGDIQVHTMTRERGGEAVVYVCCVVCGACCVMCCCVVLLCPIHSRVCCLYFISNLLNNVNLFTYFRLRIPTKTTHISTTTGRSRGANTRPCHTNV
jgi:hypothetical protein